jgi:excisionase family DNA binding protein
VPFPHMTQATSEGVLRAKPVGMRYAMWAGMTKSVFVEEAAQLLGISRRTVYYRIREGRLRTVRTAGGSQRVLVESIEALLRGEAGPTVPDAGVSDTDPSGKSPAI